MNKDSLKILLADPTFVESIIQKLLSGQTHHLIKYPRVEYPKDNKSSLELDILKESLGEEEFNILWDEGALTPQPQLYRRDVFLTGAAVAAVIVEHIWKVPAVINDVDLFYYQMNSKNTESLEHEMYENVVDENFNYRLNKNRRKNILNLVKIIPGEANFNFMNVLNSFDLTYAKVGITLGDKKLIYGDEFLDFLETRVIKIGEDNFVDHMFTTYLRGVVKAKDFQAKFYLGDYMRDHMEEMGADLFSNPDKSFPIVHSRNEIRHSWDSGPDQILVTKKKHEAWLENPSCLLPWVSIKENHVKFHIPLEPWADFYKFSYGHLSKYTEDHKGFNHGLLGVKSLLRTQNSSWFNRLSHVLKNGLSHDPRLWSNYLCEGEESFKLFKESYSFKKLELIKGFLVNHKELTHFTRFLLKEKYSLSEMIAFYTQLSKLPLNLLGLFESLCQPPHRFREISDARTNKIHALVKEKNYGQIFDLLEKFRLEEIKKHHLVDPLVIPPFKGIVKEICDTISLDKEGKDMRHCVGGYGGQIKSGKSRIFHIEIKGNKSTLELHYSKELFAGKNIPTQYKTESALKKRETRQKIKSKFKYSRNQHKGVCNSVPHPSNVFVEKRLLQYLNGDYVKTKIEKEDDEAFDLFIELLGGD